MNTAKLAQIRSDSFVGRVLRLPLRLVPPRSVVTVRSGLNAGMKWVAGASIHGCWLGHYESDKQALVKRLLKPGMKVFDIGANAGFYTLAFSRLVGTSGHVWAFEPLAENAASLLRHIELNGIANATLIQAAVADRRGITGFRVGANNSMGALADGEGTYAVPTVSLDALIDDGTLPIPDIVKMDVEGAESRVLQGAKTLLARKQTAFLIALHGRAPMEECAAILDRAGYATFGLDGRRVAPGGQSLDEIYAMPAAMQPQPAGFQ